jgi:NAD(P)-dependent dehydrogenase (short-subunit alcohol dehydrogenase family)
MRRVVITGAASGIGLASARFFLGAGDHVVVGGRTAESLRAAADALDGLGSFETQIADVTDAAAVSRLLETPADVVVANAGICVQARLDDENSDDVWHRTMNVNLHGVYHVLKAAAATMADGGSIVTVSSNLGKNARAGYEAYTASKHAVLGLTKCVALELAPRQIRVNAVCPGWVDTPMAWKDSVETARRQGTDVDSFRSQAIAGIPLGRMVVAEDVAQLIGWLASEGASAITGQSYNVACGEFFN